MSFGASSGGCCAGGNSGIREPQPQRFPWAPVTADSYPTLWANPAGCDRRGHAGGLNWVLHNEKNNRPA